MCSPAITLFSMRQVFGSGRSIRYSTKNLPPVCCIRKPQAKTILSKPNRFVLPYTELLHSVRGFGFTNYVPDPDGVLRHIPLYIKYEKNLYPSASFMIWMYLNGLQSKNVSITPAGVKFVDTVIPTDRHCFMRINLYRFRIGFQDGFVCRCARKTILNRRTFKDKIIMIGSGSHELKDLKRIPGVSAPSPVSVFMQLLLTTLLSGRFLRVTPGNVILTLTVLSGILSSVIFWFASPFRVGLPVVLGVPLALYMYAVYCFIVRSVLVNISLPSFVMVLLYVVITIYRFIEGCEDEKSKLQKEQYAIEAE